MTADADASDARSRRLDEAAAWHMRLTDGAAPPPAFGDWLSDPQNRAAFDAVAKGWDVFSDRDTSAALIERRRAALANAGRSARRRSGPAISRRAGMAAAVGLVVLGGLGAGVGLTVLSAGKAYATTPGERREITLDDGSRVSLDSNTRLVVRFSRHTRAITLEKGQARFVVAHDMRRPLTVATGEQTVAAVGTIFNIEQLGSKSLVTLLEGRVLVSPTAQPDAAAISLSPGQMLVADGRGRPTIVAVDADNASAWRQGMILLNDDTLEDAVARVNRYTDRPIMLDPRIGKVRMGGAFTAGDVNRFVEAVTLYFPIDARIGADGQVRLTPRSA